MSARPAGRRYPHVTTEAKEADHSYCPVLETIRQRVAAGKEQWGTEHTFPERLTEAEAKEAVRGLYRARNHTGKRRDQCGVEPLSIRAKYGYNGDGSCSVSVQVWPRAAAKREISRRVADGEPLAYNVLRRNQ